LHYNYRILIRLCDEQGWNLAEEFFWFNPSKLPSPIEWVNKRKIRVKDAVNTVWWLAKTDFPKADITKVLVPYSERMKLLLQNSEKYDSPKKRPSGHDISARFGEENMVGILYEKLNSEGAAEVTIPQVIQLQIVEQEGEIEKSIHYFKSVLISVNPCLKKPWKMIQFG
jgi:hypothetical protein